MPEIVIFIALQEELDIFAEHFALKRNNSSPEATGKIGNASVDVICPRDMGRVPAAIAAATYLEKRRSNLPSLILILGLAGGFSEEGTKEGHIICAKTVVDLAYRKVVDDESEGPKSKFRRRDFDLDRTLWKTLNSDKFDTEKWIAIAIKEARWPKDRRPSLHEGLITSIDEVVASDSWRKSLLKHTEKLLGVEMEAGGVCASASAYKVPVAMLRAVSDQADPSKGDDLWRFIGMKTLATLLQNLSLDELLSVLR